VPATTPDPQLVGEAEALRGGLVDHGARVQRAEHRDEEPLHCHRRMGGLDRLPPAIGADEAVPAHHVELG